jgi:PAS domain S-box-containing protein
MLKNPTKNLMANRQIRLLSYTLSHINDCVYVTDANNNITYVNQAFRTTYLYEEAEIIGLKSPVLLQESEPSGLDNVVNKELIHRRKDGHAFPVSISKSIITNDEGHISAVIVVSRDMSEQKGVEQELKRVKERVERMNQDLLESNNHLRETTTLAKELATRAESASSAKSDFVANMSHEIRTPLNAIIGMIDLVLCTDLQAEQREYLEIAHSSSEGLLSLINEILDFSKIEEGKVILEETPFNLHDLMEECIDVFGYRAQLKDLELVAYVDPRIPAIVMGDPIRLRQVIVNLIGNAIKFTEQGEVVLEVQALNIPAGTDLACTIRFAIKDTGIGISRDQLKGIFNKFSQADSSTTRKYGGTGLGLSISKSLISLMGGELSVDSEIDKGSVFEFTLTFPVDKTTDAKDILPFHNGKEIRVLLVHAHPASRVTLNRYLCYWGFEVSEASNQNQLRSFLSKATPVFDIIIVDYKLYHTVSDELKKGTREPKLIVTVPYKAAGWKRYETAGFRTFLHKPIKFSKLLLALKQVLDNTIENEDRAPTRPECTGVASAHGVPRQRTIGDKRRVHEAESSPNRSGHNARARVLLVEDTPDNQLLFSKFLDRDGYHLDVVNNGLDAVAAAQKVDYDLILMDVYMPKMDGFEATRQIRAYHSAARKERIPIIALTAHAIDGYKQKCIEQGMDDYVVKPVRKNILLAKVREWTDASKAVDLHHNT